MPNYKTIDVTIIGAGMIVHDLILPSIYQLQRMGYIGTISICSTRSSSTNSLMKNIEIKDAFPGQQFTPYPSPDANIEGDIALYKSVLKSLPPYQVVIIALPDQLHYPVIMDVLKANQHILCVKPLVLTFREGETIAKRAREKGLFIGIEYHKRFDRRALLAKKYYRNGDLGEFVIGEAKLIEPYYYRFSNFQNWFTADQTDPFVYVGCHYVDQVYFITGLKPIGVSVSGIKGKFPNGNEGYMWANGRIRFENGALLSVTNGLGYPDAGAGSNEQGLTMFFEGDRKGTVLKHNDQFRGVEYAYTKGRGPAEKIFHYVNPDFFQLIPWEGEGLKPIGYGVDSVFATIKTVCGIEADVENNPKQAFEIRIRKKEEVNRKGLIATPENSFINELVHEAARLSILNDGDMVYIDYEPEPRIRMK